MDPFTFNLSEEHGGEEGKEEDELKSIADVDEEKEEGLTDIEPSSSFSTSSDSDTPLPLVLPSSSSSSQLSSSESEVLEAPPDEDPFILDRFCFTQQHIPIRLQSNCNS